MSIEIPPTRRSRDKPWVPTHSIQNALLKNHFLDFLELYGLSAGFAPDHQTLGYDPATNHSIRMKGLSQEFRRQVIGAFVRRVGKAACVTSVTAEAVSEDQIRLTRQIISERPPLIVGAILADEDRRIWARVPLLIRADIVEKLLPSVDLQVDAALGVVYIPVGIKRASVPTDRGSVLKRKVFGKLQAEMWLWNRLLTEIQGADVRKGLVVGLNPESNKTVAMGAWPTQVGAVGVEGFFDSSVWKLAEVVFEGAQCAKGIAAIESLAWRVQVVDQGGEWIRSLDSKIGAGVKTRDMRRDRFLEVVRSTTDVRLRPNMKVDSFFDFPWANAKREIANSVNELTLLSRIGLNVTREIMAKGLPNDFESPCIDAKALGIDALSTKTLLDMCKPTYKGELVLPITIPHNRYNWRRLRSIGHGNPHDFDKEAPVIPYADERSFYVDLELARPDMMYVDNGEHCGDDKPAEATRFYDELPVMPVREQSQRGSLIFMIGCGQVIDGEWKHRAFIARSLSRRGESAILREWLEHMNNLHTGIFGQPLLHVWGPERHLLKHAMKSMTAEDAIAVKGIRSFRVIDVQQVVQTGSLTIKGCFRNSLKSVAQSLGHYGLLEGLKGRGDENLVCNGEDAMVAGLNCAEYAERNRLESLGLAPKMGQIASYNEADCRDIARIVAYLRKNH